MPAAAKNTDAMSGAVSHDPNALVKIENKGRDPLYLRKVWNTPNGQAPKEPDADVEEFQLTLGSVDDATDEARAEGAIQPVQTVPRWVIDRLKMTGYFKTLCASGQVVVFADLY